MKLSDALVGGAAVLLGAGAFLATFTFPTMPDGAPGPALFPRILAALLVLAGTVLLYRSAGARRDEGERYGFMATLRGVGVLAGIAAYVALVEQLGFLVSASTLLAGLMLILGVRVWVALPTAVMMSVGTILLFEKLLRVPLQRGLLAL
jgi:putative tricarboxylic transport membrane protein